jgi:hypothetical protein
MELERRQQQWLKDRKEAVMAEDARSIHDVSDDLLWRIVLLRLNSPIWLICTACACKRWCRVVTDSADQGRAFLRLASSLHPPTVVGQYHNYFVLVTVDVRRCVWWWVGVCGGLLAGCVLLALLFGGLPSVVDLALGKLEVNFFFKSRPDY